MLINDLKNKNEQESFQQVEEKFIQQLREQAGLNQRRAGGSTDKSETLMESIIYGNS